MFHSDFQSLEGLSRRVRDEAILKPIILQACSLIVVVSVLASKVRASNWVRWCLIHFDTCSPVRWALDKATGGPVSMLCAIAVIAVPVSSAGLSLDPRWVLVPARGDIGVSAPRARCSAAAGCLTGCDRTGVVSSSKARLSGRLLGLLMLSDGLLLPRSVDSLASLDLHR